MQAKIQLNSSISIDLQKLVESRLLVQANSGAGKSWALRRILEQSHGKIQQIVLDLEGEFATLREKFDYLLVGKGGDVPISLKSAGLLAEKLLELNVSGIIDLYELSGQDRKHYVRLFLESMINARKELWHNCLVIVDEAHVFCPEKGESEAAEAVNALVTRGRKRGFCAILATQRISKLHKDSAAECNNKLIGRCGLDIDMKRASDELGFVGRENINSLRTLSPGEFYTFGPAIADQVQKIKIGDVQTVHPKLGSRSFVAVVPPTDKIKLALKKLADLPQEIEKKMAGEKELRLEITRLRGELIRANRESPKVSVDEIQIEKRLRKEIEKETTPLIRQIKKYETTLIQIQKLAAWEGLKKEPVPDNKVRVLEKATLHSISLVPTKSKDSFPFEPKIIGSAKYLARRIFDGEFKMGSGEKKILAAVAQFQEGITREHLTVLTVYRRSSRDAYIQRLRLKGLVDLSGNSIMVTPEGIEKLGADYDPLPSGQELQNTIMARLPEGEKKILNILIAAYPDSVDRETISEQTDYQRSSRDAYLQRLKARQLVKFHSRGIVSVSEKLFD